METINNKIRPFRNYLLELSEIDEVENFNATEFRSRLMKSLKDNEITTSEFNGLSAELEYQSKKFGINTESNERTF